MWHRNICVIWVIWWTKLSWFQNSETSDTRYELLSNRKFIQCLVKLTFIRGSILCSPSSNKKLPTWQNSYRQLSLDSNDYSDIYLINRNNSRLWSMTWSWNSLKENLKELWCGQLVAQGCANCARKVRTSITRTWESQRVFVCVCASSTTC